jgi:hypothetical protein
MYIGRVNPNLKENDQGTNGQQTVLQTIYFPVSSKFTFASQPQRRKLLPEAFTEFRPTLS